MWWFLLLWQVGFGIAGVLLLGVAVRNVLRGIASRRWPQVPGRILRSFVLIHTDSDGIGGLMPQVEYEYVVEGKTHQGKRLRYGQIGAATRRRADQAIAPYPVGLKYIDLKRSPATSVPATSRDSSWPSGRCPQPKFPG